MRRRQLQRNKWLDRAINGVISGALIVAFVAAGARVVPKAEATNRTVVYRAPSNRDMSASLQVPVFVMHDDRRVVRNGAATIGPDGDFHIEFFRSVAGETPQATEALLFEPTLEVLWVVATDEAQGNLRRLFDQFQMVGTQTLAQVIGSEVFNAVYRPMLQSIIADTVSRAWVDERTQYALAALLESSDAALRRAFTGDLETILSDRVSDAVWEMIQANWITAFGVPLGYELDYTPLKSAITSIFLDPRVRETIVALGSDRLATPEARLLIDSFAVAFISGLIGDRRVPKVMSEIFWDPRLHAMMQPAYDSLVALLSALPRNLGGFGDDRHLNSLAAHVFKATVVARNTPLILFVTPAERSRIERIDREAAQPLVPLQGAG